MIRWDYPVNEELIRRLRKEYRDESIDKGNTWRFECSISYLISKLNEEKREIDIAIDRDMNRGIIQSELIDLILVASMLYWRIESIK